MGNWVCQFICIMPIQITHDGKNELQPFLDVLQIPPCLTYANNIPLEIGLHFGLYDVVLSQWDGKIKVVTSMGKQTSGKPYLLNHMVGSLLDVIKGRCIKWSVDDGSNRFKVPLCIDGL
jgi:hypothetical protein